MAAWKQKVTDALADALRFAIRGALLIDGISIVVASVYVIVKTCYFTVNYLDRTIFFEPW